MTEDNRVSALNAAKAAQLARAQRQVESRFGRSGGQFGRSGDAFARAAEGGSVQRLGGDPLTPRQFQGTGAVGVGSPIQFNQGIATGQPFTPLVPEIPLEQDPNRALITTDIDGVQPRFTVDFLVKQDSNRASESPKDTLYYWENRPEQATGRWVEISGSGGGDPVGYVTVMFPEEGITYPLINPALEALLIESIDFNFQVDSGTPVFNYNVGDTIPLGGSLTVSFTGLTVDAEEDPPVVTTQGFSASFKFTNPPPEE